MDAITNLIDHLATTEAQLQCGSQNVIVHERARVLLPKGSISGPGHLHLGCQWSGHFHRESQFVIQGRGKCEILGDFYIFDDSFVSVHGRLHLSSGYINSGAKIFVFRQLFIGDGVSIGECVTIRDSDNHGIADRTEMDGDIVIGDNVWIGMNANILKGVRIGDGAVIAAGAVVNRDVPPGMLAAGVPAKVIRPICQV
jgi:acetyltransferase-like isoleucine patch superfamily enzyme